MPKPGQMTEACTLTLWRKQEGDPVAEGDVLFEIETDKATMEVESFHDGVLLRRLVAEGEIVPVNVICAWIGAPGEEVPAGDVRAAGEVPAVEAPAAAAPDAVAPGPLAATWEPVPASAPAAGTGRRAISPRASRLAAAEGLDARSLTGTGPGGRIVERDVRAQLSAGRVGTGTEDGEEAPRPLSRMRRVIAERLTTSATTIPHFTVTVAADVTRLLEASSSSRT
jgi:pyruvate dehydrogenase E2 component (dihydrolipoamide acetyltransferase)